MSISEAHSSAARQNGAQSHGPVTDEGKARSAQNARKHGLFGPIVFNSPEENDQYHELLNAYLEEYQPTTIFETRCVREMVNSEWRLGSLRKMVGIIEETHFSVAPAGASIERSAAAAFEFMANHGQTLTLALRYEKHFQSQFDKSHKAFTESRRQAALDTQTTARADQAMAGMLKAMFDAPPPPFPDIPPHPKNVQNEPKPPAPKPQNAAFNPALNTQKAPQTTIPNLYKG